MSDLSIFRQVEPRRGEIAPSLNDMTMFDMNHDLASIRYLIEQIRHEGARRRVSGKQS